MTRSEILARFRLENPEFPSRVISDTKCNNILFTGDKEFCAAVRCIVNLDGETISTTENDTNYVLTDEITKFFDIDEYPGGGVTYNGKRLIKTTIAQLDQESITWRSRTSSTPRKYYRRLGSIYMDRPIGSAAEDIKVYAVLISNDWSTDIAPFNALTYLEPFHYGMVLYLKMRAKFLKGKREDAKTAMAEYNAYVKWTRKEITGGKVAEIQFIGPNRQSFHRY